ncbi:MAG: Ldh family oxidoreductase [Pseudorhodoplanes sp.]|nr:Ldh family oxidoreductase [Pseudorhodoplanes sp.]
MAVSYFVPRDLEAFAARLFERAGLPPEHAAIVADGLIAANLRGIDSHGVSRIPMYLTRLRRNVVNPRPNIAVQRVTPAVALVDGDNGMGFLAARRAMDEAIALAKDTGIGFVGVRRSTHYGMAAIYVMQAIAKGHIGFAWTNSSPAIPAWGGRTAFLGAAPFAAAVPGGHTPYVLDMAMTVIARGKIRLAAMHGEEIAEGLALDADGHPTRDAKKAFEGVCLPFGGVKGAALSMLMDLMCGVLTGANYAGAVKSLYFDHSEPQNVGHVCIAIRPDLFMPKHAFEQRMDHFVDTLKAQPHAAGVEEILMPGEPEERVEAERRRTGIPVTEDVASLLRAEADNSGIVFPDSSSASQQLSA